VRAVSYVIYPVLRAKRLARQIYELTVKYGGPPPPPGTFFMVWLPNYEAVPLSVADYERGLLKFVVEVRGPTTAALYTAQKVGLLGPLGKAAPSPLSKPVLVAGGIGIAPLLYMKKLWGGKLIFGARSKDRVPAIEEIDEIATEDGSLGHKGTVIDLFERYDARRDVYACGPPAMIVAIKELARKRKIKGYYSTEAHVKCGMGICGSCIADGKLLCKEPWIPLWTEAGRPRTHPPASAGVEVRGTR